MYITSTRPNHSHAPTKRTKTQTTKTEPEKEWRTENDETKICTKIDSGRRRISKQCGEATEWNNSFLSACRFTSAANSSFLFCWFGIVVARARKICISSPATTTTILLLFIIKYHCNVSIAANNLLYRADDERGRWPSAGTIVSWSIPNILQFKLPNFGKVHICIGSWMHKNYIRTFEWVWPPATLCLTTLQFKEPNLISWWRGYCFLEFRILNANRIFCWLWGTTVVDVLHAETAWKKPK